MIVAAGTTQRETEPDRGRRVDAVDDVLHEILFLQDAALAVATVVAVEAGRDDLLEARGAQ